MATYEGEVVVIFATATHPISKDAIESLTGEVHFYVPGKRPASVPADRTSDQGPYAMAWDASLAGYVAYVPTTGWEPGRWSYRVSLTGGDFANWEYGTVTVKA